MLNFSNFLIEKNLSGAPGTEGKGRGISHIIAYLGPYMSAEDRKNTIKGFHGRISKTDLPDKDGEKHHPKNDSHELGSSFGSYKAGQKIKIKHAFLDKETGKMMVHTMDHGIIPASKIKINDVDRREKKTQAGIDNEKTLSNNFGVTSSEGAANAPDFYWDGEDESGKGEIKGKLRHKTAEKPLLVGESKRNSGARMGVANLKMDKKTGKWGFSSKSDPKIVESMMNAKITGKDNVERNIVDHYNHHYRGQEVVPAGTTSAKGTGITKAYLGRYNALHLHRTEGNIDHGTSFTMNNFPYAGRTNVSHLSDNDINGLEGKLSFEKTNGGSVRITHTPDSKQFNTLAARSTVNPESNASWINPEHVNVFKNMVRAERKKEQVGGVTQQPQPRTLDHEATFAGKSYHSPDEQQHILGLA